MRRDETLKIIQVFENYGEFYQPYIPPLLETLISNRNCLVKVFAFKGIKSPVVSILPTYKKRKILEKIYGLLDRHLKRLNYLEIYSLRNEIDILHLQQSFLFSKIIGLINLPRNKKPKIVITLRGGDTYVKPWQDKKWKLFYSKYGNMVDAFIVMSNHQKKYLHKKWKVDNQRIHVIPISYGHSVDSQSLTINQEALKMVSVFRMCWEKNIEGNLRTVKTLFDRGVNITYDIYGGGQDAGQVCYLIDKYDMHSYTNYIGEIKNEELMNRLNKYHIILQLSHSESLGMSIIEAQSVGLPAIVSDSDGLPEAIVHGKSGFCVKPFEIEEAADKIEELFHDSKLYSEFSKNAILHSQEHYSIQKEVEKLMGLYQHLIPN